MKENENLLKWSTSIMTIPLSSVILVFFSEKIYMSFTMGDDNSSVREECIRDGNLVLSALRPLVC